MYSVEVKTSFSSAHSLINYPGVCCNLHGHNYIVEVKVSGKKLNKIGIFYDFKELKDAVEEIINRFDHKYLNEIPPFDRINPTSENLSKYIYKELKKKLPKYVKIERVSISESESSKVSYTGK
jgi:6-pyruvoyltetrahydropterin/6-carboxytetrahydropterin synthase